MDKGVSFVHFLNDTPVRAAAVLARAGILRATIIEQQRCEMIGVL
jgi:hypothetical protein